MTAEFPRGTAGTPGHACVGPITYHGHASVRRNLANLKAAAAAAKVEDVFFTAVAPASVGYDAANEYYAQRARLRVRHRRRRCARNISKSIKAGFVLQVDDAVLANMYDHLSQQSPKTLSRLGGAARRGAQPCARRHPGGPHPLSHLLRQLARAACRRRAARRHRRSDAAGEGRRLFDRGRQCAPRARMAACGRR